MNITIEFQGLSEKLSPSLASTLTVGSSIDVDKSTSTESLVPVKPVPDKAGNRVYRYLRWNFFSVYRRLFSIVFLGNLIPLILIIRKLVVDSRYDAYHSISTIAATATMSNIFTSLITRNEHFVNLLFRVAVSIPTRSPLFARRLMAKMYSYGGIHSGCGVAAVVWHLVYLMATTFLFARGRPLEIAVVVIGWLVLSLFIAILVFAHPHLRATLHNYFELVHRCAGWSIIAAAWAQVMLLAALTGKEQGQTLGRVLLVTPGFWLLLSSTCLVIYPWTRLRLKDVEAEPLSDHAVRLHFKGSKAEACQTVRLADIPLKELHSFACIPEPNGANGYSVVVSDAGDWTKRIIRNPPRKIWVRGVPTFGVLRVATLFKPVVVVATGSGIGPCLGLFNGFPSLPCRVLWSAPSPETTFGKDIIDIVYRADPNAVIIDTRKSGRQDMVRLTYELYKEASAEAVLVISNQKLTWKIVYGMETRGVPAYGPIWDS